MVYESDDLYDNAINTLTISIGAVTLTFNCIYYIEDPIPISVTLQTMHPAGTMDCNYNMGSTGVQNVGCNINQGLDESVNHRCGFVCSTNYGSFEYTFQGVKFALYGFYSPGNFRFDLILDDGSAEEINEYKSTTHNYALIYTSDELNDDSHTVKIKGKGEPFKLYKLAYWPSTIARRVNITDFPLSSSNNWLSQSDGIGGKRIYSKDSASVTAQKTIQCSKYWIVGTKCKWHHKMNVQFNNGEIIEVNEDFHRYDSTIVYTSEFFVLKSGNFKFIVVSTTVTLNCIYCIDEDPPPASPTPSISPLATPSISSTPIFTKSVLFSESNGFSLSNQFSQSSKFSNSTRRRASSIFIYL